MEQEGEEIQIGQHVNFEMFNDTVQAVEILLETLLTLMEDSWDNQNSSDDDDDEDEEEIVEEKIAPEIEGDSNSARETFKAFFTNNYNGLLNNIMLSFMEGQNIVSLALRLLTYFETINKEVLSISVLKCFEIVASVNPPEEILT